MVNYITIDVDGRRRLIEASPKAPLAVEFKMKLRCLSAVSLVLLISTAALAQSAAQKSFEQLKALAGSWKAPSMARRCTFRYA